MPLSDLFVSSQGEFRSGRHPELLALIVKEEGYPLSVLVVDDRANREICGAAYCIDPVTHEGEEAMAQALLTLAAYILDTNLLN
jgi:hypothetical protein